MDACANACSALRTSGRLASICKARPPKVLTGRRCSARRPRGRVRGRRQGGAERRVLTGRADCSRRSSRVLRHMTVCGLSLERAASVTIPAAFMARVVATPLSRRLRWRWRSRSGRRHQQRMVVVGRRRQSAVASARLFIITALRHDSLCTPARRSSAGRRCRSPNWRRRAVSRFARLSRRRSCWPFPAEREKAGR